jgi:hypothetical protein
MTLRNFVIAAAALAAFAAVPAAAQDIEAHKGYECRDKYLAADWMIILYNGDKPNYCDASIDKNGKIGTSACYQKKLDKIIGDLSGKLSITKHCAITGTITFTPASGKAETGDLEVYMDAAATSFVGVLSGKQSEFDVVQAIRMK